MGDLLGGLYLEGLDDAQMDDLGRVIDQILAAQMEILAVKDKSDSGEDTVGGDSENEGFLTPIPGAP
jgi:hypothetical protein